MRKISLALLVVATFFFSGNAFAAKEPSVHDVYAAVEAGRLDEAHKLIDQVVAAHPSSGKAHYVNAYVLAREGLIDKASSELALAESLNPGLPFASPDAVKKLRSLISRDVKAPPVRSLEPLSDTSNQSPKESGFPWFWVLIAVVLVVAVYMWGKRSGQKSLPTTPYSQPMPPFGGGNQAPESTAPRRWSGPADSGYQNAQTASSGPSLASRIGGGLATGAAVGVGMVAAQHLMSNMLDVSDSSDHNSMNPIADASANEGTDTDPAVDNDVSASDPDSADFGVNESENWDETSEQSSEDGSESESWEDDSSSDSGGDWE